ncbi:MAG: ribose-5-phosphate isomerase RpiA [Thermaerobacter sp.]|nr:ribose-5-phosphate isomerase RpiA [Thermaerobacter sp.]
MHEALLTAVGAAAAELVLPGMRLGIGSGRTVGALLAALAPRVRQGLQFDAACASRETAQIARQAGIRVLPEEEVGALDLAIDGADVVTPQLDCLKGLGGALARERLVALGARRFVLIAEESKLRQDLSGLPVPIEVLPFAHVDTARRVRSLGLEPRLRQDAQGLPYRTDNGNFILDCTPQGLRTPHALQEALERLAGVVATGYFLGMAQEALLAGPDGIRRIAIQQTK